MRELGGKRGWERDERGQKKERKVAT